VAQNIEKNILSVREQMLDFLRRANIDVEPYDEVADASINNFVAKYREKIRREQMKDNNSKLIVYELPLTTRAEINFFTQLQRSPYSENDFVLPRKIDSMIFDRIENIIVNGAIDTPRFQDYDFSEYKEIIQSVINCETGSFQLPLEDKRTYTKNFESLLKTDSLAMKNNTANIKTLLETSRDIYSFNREKIKAENVLCESVERYLSVYENVIDKVRRNT
jgi:hypothetical protein